MFQMNIISRVFKTAVTILKFFFSTSIFSVSIYFEYFGGFFVHGLFLVKSFGYNKIHAYIKKNLYRSICNVGHSSFFPYFYKRVAKYFTHRKKVPVFVLNVNFLYVYAIASRPRFFITKDDYSIL